MPRRGIRTSTPSPIWDRPRPPTPSQPGSFAPAKLQTRPQGRAGPAIVAVGVSRQRNSQRDRKVALRLRRPPDQSSRSPRRSTAQAPAPAIVAVGVSRQRNSQRDRKVALRLRRPPDQSSRSPHRSTAQAPAPAIVAVGVSRQRNSQRDRKVARSRCGLDLPPDQPSRGRRRLRYPWRIIRSTSRTPETPRITLMMRCRCFRSVISTVMLIRPWW